MAEKAKKEDKTETEEKKPAGLVVSQDDSGDFEITPEGVYTARCYRLIDLGTQDVTFKGETKQQHKVLVSWELIGKDDPKMTDGQPFSVHKQYTMSFSNKANLYKDLISWRGRKFTEEELKSFDLGQIIDSYCQIQVGHDEGKDGNTYTNVTAIMAYKGDKPDSVNDNVVFSLAQPDWDVFENLSDNLQGRIKKSPEYKMLKGDQTPDKPTEAESSQDTDLDDIPF